jgi:hypothetical protein
MANNNTWLWYGVAAIAVVIVAYVLLSGGIPSIGGASVTVNPTAFVRSTNTAVTLSGTGFSGNAQIGFTANGTLLPITVTSSSTGTFSNTWGYPGGGVLDGIIQGATTGSSVTMTATDGVNSASASFTVQ